MGQQSKRSKSSHSSLIPHAGKVTRFLEQCLLVKKYTIGFIDGRRRGHKKEVHIVVLNTSTCQLKVCSDGAAQILVVSLHDTKTVEELYAVLCAKMQDNFRIVLK